MFKAELRAAEVDPRFDICRVGNEQLQIKVTPHYSSERSEIESTWTHKSGVHVDSISDLSDENGRSDFDLQRL